MLGIKEARGLRGLIAEQKNRYAYLEQVGIEGPAY